MSRAVSTRAGGAIPPASEKGPAVAAASAPQENKRNGDPNCRDASHAGQALRVIEGEGKADLYLARLRCQQADPDELALVVSTIYGATLRCLCRVIARSLGSAA